ncbi:MAG: DUF3164 family protein [Desulfovibrio sp.]
MQQQEMMQDAQGRLVPLGQIKEIDRVRHDLVMELVEQFLTMRESLRDLKLRIMGDIGAFVQMSAEQYGVTRGGEKGNVQLLSFDGRYKIVRAIGEHLAFDERLQAAQELIHECLTEWTEGSRGEIRALINDAFQVDQQGKLNAGRILGLRRLDIKDERWKRAMEAISDSITVLGTKAYVRLYERNEQGGYDALPLDIAKV